MHRSGTSAVAGLLNNVGINCGKDLLPVSKFNKRGYFENREVVAINEELLKEYSATWDTNISFENVQFGANQTLRNRAKKVLEEFVDDDVFLLKDPRISLLFPFWEDLLTKSGVLIECILVIRNPIEIADSLRKRNDLDFDYSINLWYNYVKQAEIFSRPYSRIIVHYDDLLSKDKDLQNSINKFLQDSRVRVDLKTQNIVSRQLKHSNIEFDSNVLTSTHKKLYSILSRKQLDTEILDEIYSDQARDEKFYTNKLANLGTTFYIDQGEGFSEDNTRKVPLNIVNGFSIVELKLNERTAIKQIRWDPLEHSCSVAFIDIELAVGGKKYPVDYNGLLTNGFWIDVDTIIFESEDPQIYFPKINNKNISIKLMFDVLDRTTKLGRSLVPFSVSCKKKMNEAKQRISKLENSIFDFNSKNEQYVSYFKSLEVATSLLKNEVEELQAENKQILAVFNELKAEQISTVNEKNLLLKRKDKEINEKNLLLEQKNKELDELFLKMNGTIELNLSISAEKSHWKNSYDLLLNDLDNLKRDRTQLENRLEEMKIKNRIKSFFK